MAGTPVITGFLAQAIFWALLGYGVVSGELRPYRAVAFAAAWLVARLMIAWLVSDPFAMLGSSFVAMLDVALVLMIFHGDIRLR
jgi:hypothetical protein